MQAKIKVKSPGDQRNLLLGEVRLDVRLFTKSERLIIQSTSRDVGGISMRGWNLFLGFASEAIMMSKKS